MARLGSARLGSALARLGSAWLGRVEAPCGTAGWRAAPGADTPAWMESWRPGSLDGVLAARQPGWSAGGPAAAPHVPCCTHSASSERNRGWPGCLASACVHPSAPSAALPRKKGVKTQGVCPIRGQAIPRQDSRRLPHPLPHPAPASRPSVTRRQSAMRRSVRPPAT